MENLLRMLIIIPHVIIVLVGFRNAVNCDLASFENPNHAVEVFPFLVASMSKTNSDDSESKN